MVSEKIPEFARESALADIPVTILKMPDLIHHFGDASLSVQSASGSLAAESKLIFSTSEDIDLSNPVSFIVETHSGDSLMIGAFEPPYPEIKKNYSTGASPKDRHAITYTVTWPSIPIPVLGITSELLKAP